MRLKLTLAYDGAAFRGWQSQPGGGAVQDVLQEALQRIAGGVKCPVQGAGRTDAGVHALGQTAHADVPEGRRDAAFWMKVLNATLPPAVRVLRCRRVRADFHARFSATGKVYDYILWTGEVMPPHRVGRAWHVWPPPDPKVLAACGRILEGRHDFRGFSANRGTPVHDSHRTVSRVRVTARGREVRLRFEGEGFLYKMVRMMAAAMVRAATGRASVDELRARLEGRPESQPRVVAPADGLYLVGVTYGRRVQTD